MLLAAAAAFPCTISLLGTYSMAKKPAIDKSTYSRPANLPGFLVDLMLPPLLKGPGEGVYRRDVQVSRNVSPDQQKAAVVGSGRAASRFMCGPPKRRQSFFREVFSNKR